MNLFARGIGGVFSDALQESMGMRGRLIAQTMLLLLEGIAVVVFARTDTLAGAVIVLVLFSLFVQAAEGASYGIVPYVDPINMGSVTGIVGAGGNVGAVCFGMAFRNLDYEKAFMIMGCSIIVSSFLSVFIHIKGHSGLLTGKDQLVDKETGEIVNMNSLKRGKECDEEDDDDDDDPLL
jgi:NNP family nitrate/nitrite transporter-like MFS transporter